MANKTLFQNKKSLPQVDTVNESGGSAYSLKAKESLATLASCGTLHSTFYASGEQQLNNLKDLLEKVDTDFICQLAIYSRQRGFMKDMPAYLLAYLTTRDIETAKLEFVFTSVCDSMKMLRNFVQILRSGQVGRKSLGSRPKRLVQNWLNNRSPFKLFQDSVGQSPSIQDIIKMVHPRPIDDAHNVLYKYFLDGSFSHKLPANVINFEALKENANCKASYDGIDFRKLTTLNLTCDNYCSIAKQMGWHALRMNLNALAKQGIFAKQDIIDYVVNKLSDSETVLRSKTFPYQLFTAYENVDATVPPKVKNSLQVAMEYAVGNIPSFENEECLVLLDVSSSMNNPVTGDRDSVTSKSTNMNVAAVIASSIMRRNPNSELIVFNDSPKQISINPYDSIMTITKRLSEMCRGGTNTASSLALADRRNLKYKNVVMISDNQSWMDALVGQSTTESLEYWAKYSGRVKGARIACINISPYTNTQLPDRENVLNIGGWNDTFFTIVDDFFRYGKGSARWVKEIESINLL